MMLQRGLASIVKHRTDDERSAHYEVLLEAEQVLLLPLPLLVQPSSNPRVHPAKRERYCLVNLTYPSSLIGMTNTCTDIVAKCRLV